MNSDYIHKYLDDLDSVDASSIRYIETNLKLWNASGLIALVQQAGKRARFDRSGMKLLSLRDFRAVLREKFEECEKSGSDVSDLKMRLREVDDQLEALTDASNRDKNTLTDKGYILIDFGEATRESYSFNKFGSLIIKEHSPAPYVVVECNLLIAHEFAHQLFEFVSPEFTAKIESVFERKRNACRDNPDKKLEILAKEDVSHRHFISSYARCDVQEYFAECVAAFSVKQSRNALFEIDPEMHSALLTLVRQPESLLREPWGEQVSKIQAERGSETNSYLEAILEEEGPQPYADPSRFGRRATERETALDIAVRLAIAGVPWREICHSFAKYNLTDEEVEREVQLQMPAR